MPTATDTEFDRWWKVNRSRFSRLASADAVRSVARSAWFASRAVRDEEPGSDEPEKRDWPKISCKIEETGE